MKTAVEEFDAPELPVFEAPERDGAVVWFCSGLPVGSVVWDRFNDVRYRLTAVKVRDGVLQAVPVA